MELKPLCNSYEFGSQPSFTTCERFHRLWTPSTRPYFIIFSLFPCLFPQTLFPTLLKKHIISTKKTSKFLHIFFSLCIKSIVKPRHISEVHKVFLSVLLLPREDHFTHNIKKKLVQNKHRTFCIFACFSKV